MDPSHRIRPLAALRALRRLLKDKEDTSQVFIITSSLRGKSALRGARRLCTTQAVHRAAPSYWRTATRLQVS